MGSVSLDQRLGDRVFHPSIRDHNFANPLLQGILGTHHLPFHAPFGEVDELVNLIRLDRRNR